MAEQPAVAFDWTELRAWVAEGPIVGMTVAEMRQRDLL
jgi:hypothetical protein